MTGNVIIDGIDIVSFGAILLREGSAELLKMPTRREVENVNWYEKNGVDADLDEVSFSEHSVSLSFMISSTSTSEYLRYLQRFYMLISAPGLREVYIRSFQRSFSMRYTSCEEYRQKGHFSRSGVKSSIISITFSVDDPLQIFNLEIMTPVWAHSFSSFVEINNIDLSKFGVIVSQVYDTALKLGDKKEPLTIISEINTGVHVDNAAQARFDKQDITIHCNMIAPSLQQFYSNYNALFNHLSQRGELLLRFVAAQKCYKCYYVEQQVTGLVLRENSCRLTFSITLRTIDFEFSTYSTRVLGDENRRAILTETRKLIDVNF